MSKNFPPDKFEEHDGLTGTPPAPSIWGVDVDHTTVLSFSGDSSFLFQPGSPGYLMTQWFPVMENRAYIARLIYAAAIGDNSVLGIEYAAGNMATPYTAGPVVATAGTGAWEEAHQGFSPPANMRFARIYFGMQAGAVSIAYLDSVSVIQSPFYSRVYFGTGTGPYATATWVLLTPALAGFGYDPFGLHAVAESQFLIKGSGDYIIDISGHLTGLATGKKFQIRTKRFGAVLHTSDWSYSKGDPDTHIRAQVPMVGLNMNDPISFEIYHDDTVTLNDFTGKAQLRQLAK